MYTSAFQCNSVQLERELQKRKEEDKILKWFNKITNCRNGGKQSPCSILHPGY